LLKPLQERHETPYHKDVIFHEVPEIGNGHDLCIKGMVQQRRTKTAKLVIVVFRHVFNAPGFRGDLRLPTDGFDGLVFLV
jgi:hypothetical protein